MTSQLNSTSVSSQERHWLEIFWQRIVDGLAALGTVLIGVLMLLICSDIVARNLFGASLPMISELGALTLVMIVYLQLSAAIRADRLAKTEIFITTIGSSMPRLAELIVALFHIVGAGMFGLIAWSTIRILGKDYASGEFLGVPGIATLPTWPFRVLILVGALVAAIEFLVQAKRVLFTSATKSKAQ